MFTVKESNEAVAETVTPGCGTVEEGNSWETDPVKKPDETISKIKKFGDYYKKVTGGTGRNSTVHCNRKSKRSCTVSKLIPSFSLGKRRIPRSRSAEYSPNNARSNRLGRIRFSARDKSPGFGTLKNEIFKISFQTITEKNEAVSDGEDPSGGIRRGKNSWPTKEKKNLGIFKQIPHSDYALVKSSLTDIIEGLFRPLYKNFRGSRTVLVRQARDLLLCTYLGNFPRFRDEFCIPGERLVRRLKHHVEKFGIGIAIKGWPLYYGNDGIVLHLGEIDESLLRNRDCYVCLRKTGTVGEDYKRNGIEVALIWKNGKKTSSKTILKEGKAVDDEIVSPLTMSEAAKTEDELASLLQNLLVSVEHAICRVPIECFAFPCPKCHEYFEFEAGSHGAGAEECGCECSARPRQIEKKDSSIQTSPMFEIVESIPHIDSDDEGEGREDDEDIVKKDVETENDKVEEQEQQHHHHHQQQQQHHHVYRRSVLTDPDNGSVSTGTMTRKSREIIPPKNLDELPQRILMSGVLLPGTRDLEGHSIIIVEGETIIGDKLTSYEIAKILLYYSTISEKGESSKGITVLFLLPRGRDPGELVGLLDQAFYLARKHFKIHIVLLCRVKDGNFVSADDNLSLNLSFPKTKIKYQYITDEPSLRNYISSSETPNSCGGKASHDQLEWIEFFKEFEPFVNLCNANGRRLVDLMTEFRIVEESHSQVSRRQIQHQEKMIGRTLRDPDFQRLRNDGSSIMSRLEERAQWLSSIHVRSNLDRGRKLFAEVDRASKRLEHLLEKRRQRLKEVMRLRALEDESSQVLSWLVKRGEETLKKHSELAANIQGIKNQEQDFEKFYFVSMRHLDKGNDLIDEIRQSSNDGEASSNANDTSNLQDLAKSLKYHLKGFGEKLEDTREKLEDTSRCFYLLDKTYEWSLETSKYINRIKGDDDVSEELAKQLINNIELRLANHPPLPEAHFAEMNNLAKKLDNEKLTEQCRLAQSRYREAFEIVRNMQGRLLQIINASVEEPPTSPFLINWNQIMNRIPGGGAFNIGRRRSLASFPYIYKCSHHAAGHDCTCDGTVTRDPSKSSNPLQKANATQCLCACGSALSHHSPLTDIRENQEDLSHQKISDWECGGNRSAIKRHLRRTSTWQYPAEGFDDQDNNSNKSSHSGESDNKDLDEHYANLNAPSVPVSLSVNSHLYCHASNLSLQASAPGEQAPNAKTQKTLLLIIREMIQTERDYVASLEYVIENYIPQLLREDIPQALRGQRNVVFGNIEKIYEFHSQNFLNELEGCEKSPLSVGQCFLKYEKKFYLYALYNKNKPKSDSLMTEYGSNFFKMKQLELGDKMDLASYLLKPVQRMGKYALLLQQLMKASGERESSDLSAAEAMVRFQLRHGNDLLAMDSLRDCDVNLKEQGRLLRQNEFLVWQGKGKKCLRHVFLFEELILFSKARRFPDRKNLDIYIYKNSIKTTDIGLTAKIGDSPTKFEIWFRKRKPNDTFTLQSMSEEVKQAWTEELSGILWKQALKNREMRLQEMSSMGIGNKPCLDIRPSADQINDRSISVAQLSKTAPRLRNSIAILSRDVPPTNRRPHSIISVTSSSSSGGSTGSGSHVADSPRLSRSALHSQCSAESGIITDMSLTSEDLEGRDRRWPLERSNSTVTSTSMDSSLSPVLSSDDVSGFATSTYDNDVSRES